MKKNRKEKTVYRWDISFLPVIRYNIIFCLLTLAAILSGGLILSASRMKSTADIALANTYAQTTQRINESINLLEALAGLPEFYASEIPPIEKVKKLDSMAPYLDYLMMCYVDSDITVYSDGSEPASLASRDYMQKLFSTGETQVTDSFAAGADGVTLNYTVAVPLIDEQGNITGCLFSAIYFDEIVEMLESSTENISAEATLVGSVGQMMSSTAGLPYGNYLARLRIGFRNSFWPRLREVFGVSGKAAFAIRSSSVFQIANGIFCVTLISDLSSGRFSLAC